MQHFTCDVCGMPIKEGDYWTLSMVGNKQKNQIYTAQDYYDTMGRLIKEIKDICPACKLIIDEIFRLRRDNLYLLSEELLGIWKLKSKGE